MQKDEPYRARSEEGSHDQAQANHYLVAGSGIDGTIDSASLGGQPRANIRAHETPLSDTGTQRSEDGVEVTVTVEAAPDLRTRQPSAARPESQHRRDTDPFAERALFVTSIGEPALLDGPLNKYALRPLSGIAEAVQT
jgi:hypothetical protein